jgi:hypothetical protein
MAPPPMAAQRQPKRRVRCFGRRNLMSKRAAFAVRPFTHAALSQALAAYTRHDLYLSGLRQPGAMRVDLEGNAVEPVSDGAIRRAAEIAAEHRQRRANDVKPGP